MNLDKNTLKETLERVGYLINKKACWVCTSHACGSGVGQYPRVSIKGKLYKLSRIFYAYYNGALNSEELVRHTCDNPACINPKHLIKGTYADNNKDRQLRKRSRPRKGSKNGRAKLTNAQVLTIFNNPQALSIPQCMKKYRVSRPTVDKIRSGETWQSVTGICGDSLKERRKRYVKAGNNERLYY